MLGDAGAHALGAALGVAAVVAATGTTAASGTTTAPGTTAATGPAGGGRGRLVAYATALLALALVGDKVSHGEALWGAPVVRALDTWGRRDTYG